MTRRFALYLCIVLVCYLTMNYNAYDVLVFVLFALLLLPLLALLYVLLQRRDLVIEQSFEPERLPHGLDARLLVHVRRRLPLPIFGLELITRSVPWPESNPSLQTVRYRSLLDRLRGRAGHEIVRIQAAGREDAAFALQFEAEHRGHYALGIHGGRLEDPFGFFRLPIAARIVPEQLRLTILPSPPQSAVSRRIVRTLVDERPRPQQRFSTDLDEVARLRAYRPGDSMKLVHWSVSSHLRQLQIREFAEPRQPAAGLVCEGLHGDLRDPLRWRMADLAGDLALDLSLVFSQTRQPLSLYLPVSGAGDLIVGESGPEGQAPRAELFSEQNTRLLALRGLAAPLGAEARRRDGRLPAGDGAQPASAATPEPGSGAEAADPHVRECLRCLHEEVPSDLAVCYLVFLDIQDAHIIAMRQLVVTGRQVILLTLAAHGEAATGSGGAAAQIAAWARSERLRQLREAGVIVVAVRPPWAEEAPT